MAAVLLPGQPTPALHTLASDSPTILRFVRRIQRQGPVQYCCEAGPCGFELQRALVGQGIPCDVIAPALIPRRSRDRSKTEEREEAARDLLRCREDIRADLLRARHLLSTFLLRHGRRFTGTKKAWSKRHEAWPRAQTWPLHALEQTHHAYLRTVDEAVARLRAVEEDLRALLTLEPLRPRVQRLRCFRGIDESKRPGTTGGIIRLSETRYGRDSAVPLPPLSRGLGPPSSVCIGAMPGSPRAANPNSMWSPPPHVS